MSDKTGTPMMDAAAHKGADIGEVIEHGRQMERDRAELIHTVETLSRGRRATANSISTHSLPTHEELEVARALLSKLREGS